MENQNSDLERALKKAARSLDFMETIALDEFPNIEMYMDKVTTFMDRKLRSTLRNPGDKVLTKTMINNYAKNDLIPPPNKKKYNKEHLFELLFIFYFKSFLSIGDIQTLLTPLNDEFFGKGGDFGIQEIYAEILKMGRGSREAVRRDMTEKFSTADDAFKDLPENQRDYLRKFAYICEMGYDIFLKKSIIEQMIDEMDMESLRESD
jgi:DNA-binding transcriptional MerR regulator